MTLATAGESSNTLQKYKQFWSKIRDLTKSVTNSKLNDSKLYDEKYMKIKFKTHDNLPLKSDRTS